MRNGENCIYPLVIFTGSVNSVLNQNGSADTSVSSFADNHCNDTSDAALLGDSVLEEDSCCYFCHGRGDLVRCTVDADVGFIPDALIRGFQVIR